MRRPRGAALVVVLAFVVLLLGVILAFFTLSSGRQKTSRSSASQTATELFSQGAVNAITADLLSEIKDLAHSTSYQDPGSGVTLYFPASPARAVPDFVVPGATLRTAGLENLVKVSSGSAGAFSGAASRAFGGASTLASSGNGRLISRERWNKPLLMPAASFYQPTPPSAFPAPDWILVNRGGGNPSSWNKTAMIWSSDFAANDVVVGRYAYAIYNEGGLLDANVAGYPSSAKASAGSGSLASPVRYKVGSPYADLTAIGMTQSQTDLLAGWRNAATLSERPAESFWKLATTSDSGFREAMSLNASGSQTDRQFIGRGQLLGFFETNLNAANDAAVRNALRFLGTFSRSLNTPTFARAQSVNAAYPKYSSQAPKVNFWSWPQGPDWPNDFGNAAFGFDLQSNPALAAIRVAQTGSAVRMDGTKFVKGEPLVKTRFDLNRLAWLTCKGPSAALSQGDPVLQAYVDEGLDAKFLAEGTAQKIRQMFGLRWVAGSGSYDGYWVYDGHGAGSNPVAYLEDVAVQEREPDFFELLKSAIDVGAIGKGRPGWHASNPATPGENLAISDNLKMTTYTNNQIIQIGANMIDQAGPDNFPTHIVFDDGTRVRSFWGTVDLPYFSGLFNLAVLHQQANPMPSTDGTPRPIAPRTSDGDVAVFLVPVIWNPHDAPVSSAAYPAALSPRNLRLCVTTLHPAATAYFGTQTPMVLVGMDAANGIFYTYPNFSDWNANISLNPAQGTIETPVENATNNTAMYFANVPSLYRQPTPLMNPGVPAGSGLALDSGNLLIGKGYPQTGVTEFGTGDSYIGVYFGRFPLVFDQGSNSYTLNSAYAGVGDLPTKGLTFSLEFQDGSHWVPYRQVVVGLSQLLGVTIPRASDGSNYDTMPVKMRWDKESSSGQRIRGHFSYDPRTIRWNTNGEIGLGPLSADGTMPTLRPGMSIFPPGITSNGYGAASTDNFILWDFFRDADGVLRRPTGAYVPSVNHDATTLVGLPMATPGGGNQRFNRPILLHRPFRSVGELGYVFSDTPWRNLDFFTPESGFSGLLDVFCIGESQRADAVIAGKVDLNTRQPKVLEALLTDAYRDERDGLFGYAGEAAMSQQSAATLAEALVARTTSSAPGKGPLENLADLVGRFAPDASNGFAGAPAPFDGFSKDFGVESGVNAPANLVERLREAPVRALSSSGQVGTWNLMIDLIAQTGRYGPNASGVDAFTVEGERRLWVHIAIDRLTGKVIDRQIEVVSE